MTAGLLISAPASGTGKTTLTLGLIAALRGLGVKVHGFKNGPDYIDPAFHAVASGLPSYNLDCWAMPESQIGALIESADGADIIIAEGSMGLFDGVATRGATAKGATADLAALTGWPVILVLDVSGQAQSAGAVALGFAKMRPDVTIAGVVANRVASPRHEAMVRDGLAQCGFEVTRVPGVPPKRDNLHATYNPRWEPRTTRQPVATPEPALPGPCIVIGGGIAGAAAAASLARRGWQVVVLDQAPEPAAGASALPAGVFAPHVSPDDSVLSRLSRSGIRTTLEQARWLLSEGMDWAHCGVLEHRTDGTPGLSPAWDQGPGAAWSEPAPSAALAAAQLPPDATACWHHQAGWVRPARPPSSFTATTTSSRSIR